MSTQPSAAHPPPALMATTAATNSATPMAMAPSTVLRSGAAMPRSLSRRGRACVRRDPGAAVAAAPRAYSGRQAGSKAGLVPCTFFTCVPSESAV